MRVQQSPSARFSNRNSKIWRRTRGAPRTRPIPRVLAPRVGRILVRLKTTPIAIVTSSNCRTAARDDSALVPGPAVSVLGSATRGQFNGLRLAANYAAPRAARTCFPAIASPLAASTADILQTAPAFAIPAACSLVMPKTLWNQPFTSAHAGGSRQPCEAVLWRLPIGDHARDGSFRG